MLIWYHFGPTLKANFILTYLLKRYRTMMPLRQTPWIKVIYSWPSFISQDKKRNVRYNVSTSCLTKNLEFQKNIWYTFVDVLRFLMIEAGDDILYKCLMVLMSYMAFKPDKMNGQFSVLKDNCDLPFVAFQ